MAKKRKDRYEIISEEIKMYKQILKDPQYKNKKQLRGMIEARESQLKMFRRETFYEQTKKRKKIKMAKKKKKKKKRQEGIRHIKGVKFVRGRTFFTRKKDVEYSKKVFQERGHLIRTIPTKKNGKKGKYLWHSEERIKSKR